MIGPRVGTSCGLIAGPRVGVGTDEIAPQSTTNLVLLWGQSNITGQDDYNTSTNSNGYINSYSPVTLSSWNVQSLSDPLVFTQAGTVGGAAPYAAAGQVNFGPELSLARHLNRVVPGGFRIAKWGINQSGLAANWLPSAAFPTAGPNLFTRAMNDAQAQAAASGASIKCLVWGQGEQDALTTGPASAYAANLAAFVAAVRAVFGPTFPVVICRIPASSPETFNTTVYNAQTNFVSGDAHAALVNTDDLTPLITTYHFTSNNLVTFGNRIATAVLGLLGIADVPVSKAWTVDGDGIGFPQNATEWAAVMAAAGITSGGPFHAANLNAASGNLSDLIGAVTLTASGTGGTYNAAVPGFTRTGFSTPDAATAKFATADTSFPDLSTTSALSLSYVRINATPGTFRNITSVGLAAGVRLKNSVKSGGNLDVFEGNTNNTISSRVPGPAVRPMIIQHNRATTAGVCVTDQESFTITFDATVAGKGLEICGGGNLAPAAYTLYTATFKGAAAEMTVAQMKSLLSTLGWILQF